MVRADGEKVVNKAMFLGLGSQPVQIFVQETREEGPMEPVKLVEVSVSKELVNAGLAIPCRNREAVEKILAIPENLGQGREMSNTATVEDFERSFVEQLDDDSLVEDSNQLENMFLGWGFFMGILRT